MKWKDSSDQEPIRDTIEPEEDYPEGVFSPTQERRIGKMLQIVLGIGAVVVVILLFLLLPRGGDDQGSRVTEEKLAAVETRLQQLGETVRKYERLDERFAKAEEGSRRVDQFRERLERLEATLSQRLDELTDRVEGMGKHAAAESAKPAAAAPAPKPPAAAPPAAPAAAKPATAPAPKKESGRQYIVKAGDTLFSISKANGLSVEQLRKINDLSPTATIQAGQKLTVEQ